ncbi:Aste57867_19871 [Aphanomyces stellatus]|uniref:Aste57867_19871 protein n=1 Tax=Aphanomyces stellatus TaxID=120398 RepID=A0A485LEB3_9STRA|nr:hypothetical protein As57867_019805 [Aphanomyces stellatus]VFT96569.1 Aste57867_19871 [Aphanomyces stellatus]
MLPTADVFDCQPLPPVVLDNLLATADRAWKGLVENAIASESYPIDKILRNPTTGRCATLRRPRDIVDATEGVVAHTRTRATIEEAADFFYIDTPAKAQQFARVMDELVEAKRALYPLLDRTIVDNTKLEGGIHKPLDYMSVDWMMIRFKKGVPARDLCYLEIHKEFHFTCHLTGTTRRGWVRCIHSVRLDCCPDMQKKYGVIRMEIHRSGHVFMETNEPGVLDYYKLYFGSPRGAVLGNYFNNLYLKGAMRTSARAILNLDEHFTTERLKPLLSAPLHSNHLQTKACCSCRSSFTWRHPRKICRACGVAICGKCSSQWSFMLHDSVIKVSLCGPCVGPSLDDHIESHTNYTYAKSAKTCRHQDNHKSGFEFKRSKSSPGSMRETLLSVDVSIESQSFTDIMQGIDQQKELLVQMQERLAGIVSV